MNDKWNKFIETPSLKFRYQVPKFTPSIYREYRGEIFTTFHSEEHPVMKYLPFNKEKLNIHNKFSKSYKGVLRGLHSDNKTWKLIQALVGDLYLVVLDMRQDSFTYGEWESFILTEKSRDQILVPPGFANGHYALTDCIFHYNLFYKGECVDSVDHEIVKWNDPEFQIEWPADNPILQKKDK